MDGISNGQPTLSDDLKSNFRSWETDCDNEEDAMSLFAQLIYRHPYLSQQEIKEAAYEWVGYELTEGE